MFEATAWKIISGTALAASRLPRPIYFRLLAFGLEPLWRLIRRQCPAAARVDVPRHGATPVRASNEETGIAAEPLRDVQAPRPPHLGPRALVIDGFVPTPDRDAASNDICWFMRILLGLGYEVTFIPAFTVEHAGRYTEDLRTLGIICPVAPALTSARDFIVGCGDRFDLVAVYRITVAEALIGVVREFAPKAKIIFNTVDLHFLRDQRQAELDGQLHAFVEAKRREKQELLAIRSADAAVLLSEFEFDYVGRHAADARRFLIPLALPVPGRSAPFEGRSGILFVGGFAHAPNVDAVHFLCGTIWPFVRGMLPDATLFVVGADPPDAITAYDDPSSGVKIMGHVADLSGLYRSVRVAVAPLRFGAGLKGKVVASLAVGVPCVVTSTASEGMPDGSANALIVADEARAFAQAIARAHTDAGLWQSMSDAGIAYARRHFAIEAVARKTQDMLTELKLPHKSH